MNQFLQFGYLAKQSKIKHAISTKKFNSIKKENGTIHHARLIQVLQAAKIKAIPITMEQIHSGTVTIVENNRELRIPQTDVLVTKQKNLALCILTADCLPIFLYDPVKNIIAAIHAGRKGLTKNIIENTVTVFKTEFDSDPRNIFASIGPGIEEACYQVGKDVYLEVIDAFPNFTNIGVEKKGHYYLNLRAIAVQSLQKAGILKRHIEVTDLCTYCNTDQLYSYRKGDKSERFVSIIALQ